MSDIRWRLGFCWGFGAGAWFVTLTLWIIR